MPDDKADSTSARMRCYALQPPSSYALGRKKWSMPQITALGWLCSVVTSSSATVIAGSSNSTPFGVSGATDSIISEMLQNPFPYAFPDFAQNSIDWFSMPNCNGVVLEEATIDEMQDAMRRGQLTSVTMAMCYLQRIYQTDEYINAIIQLNPDFLQIASTLDAERAAGHLRSRLHGIPFLIKDNIASKDKMETTAGSWALLGSIVPRDAHVVAKLRQQGALLLGKATLSEWADMRSSNYSEGYSARGGQARSPYNLTVNPGGSSSGSAAAVAGNLCMFALGTETDGSVINPAERNALVGIKPTVGLTSRAGVVPESQHQDSVGTFARTVRDAAYAFDAIYGVDPRDNYTLAQEGKTPAGGYSQFLTDKSALKNATFGLPWQSFWVLADEEQRAALVETIKEIEAAGAAIVNGTELMDWERIVSPKGWDWDYGSTRGYSNESEFTVVKVDFYNNIKAYLAELNNTNIKSLEDIVQYNIDNVGTEGGLPGIHPAFGSGQDSFLASLATKGIMDSTYHTALSFCQTSTRENGIDYALSHNITALLVPPDVGQTYQIAAQAGYPMITIPASTNSKTSMPYGLALMGTAWSEPNLVRWASAIEDLGRETGKWGRTRPRWGGVRERNLPVLNL